MKTNNIIGTIEISHEIENLIQDSFRTLIFVSPYLKITERIKSKLSIHLPKIDNCFFIYRKSELRNSERLWLESFSNIHLIEVKNLHSKVYLNDNKCILTSMNFYEYSQINNFEIGIIIDRKNDKESFEGVIEQILLMTKLSSNNIALQKELDKLSDFSAGKLFLEIRRITSENRLKDYENFCNEVRKIINIEINELYEDGSAILRRADLGQERYLKVFNTLK